MLSRHPRSLRGRWFDWARSEFLFVADPADEALVGKSAARRLPGGLLPKGAAEEAVDLRWDGVEQEPADLLIGGGIERDERIAEAVVRAPVTRIEREADVGRDREFHAQSRATVLMPMAVVG